MKITTSKQTDTYLKKIAEKTGTNPYELANIAFAFRICTLYDEYFPEYED